MSKKLLYLIVLVLAVTGTASADTWYLPVPDPGFEDHVLTNVYDYAYINSDNYTGAWSAVLPEAQGAWIGWDYWYPGDSWPPLSGTSLCYGGESAPDYIYQILDEIYVEGAEYTFEAWIAIPWSGYANNFRIFFTEEDYNTNLAETSGKLNPASKWLQKSVSYTATAADAGKKIGIKMYGDIYVTFDEITLLYDGPGLMNLSPANGAVDVSVETNLTWIHGDSTFTQEEVYFGTDPCALPLVATLIPPALEYDPGDPNIIASTTYYWYIVGTDTGAKKWSSPVWSFTTVLGNATIISPLDGSTIPGDPYPSPPAMPTHVFTTMVFGAGPTAVKHVGYFSENYADVAGRVQDANLGPPPYPGTPGYETTYYAGMPLVEPMTDSLVRGTKYYWVVDATDALDNEYPGDIWEFTIQPLYAYAPSPPNEARMMNTDVLLKWKPGAGATEHDVYMGTSWEDVNNAVYSFSPPLPPEFMDTRSEPNYQASGLANGTKIYWRVDEVSGRLPPLTPGTVYKGDIWCFTTHPEGVGTIREDLWWGIAGAAIGGLYNDPRFPSNPDETRFLTMFDSGTALGNDYGGMIHGWLYPAYSGDYKFWIAADDQCDLFLSTDDQPANMSLIASAPGWVNPYEWEWYASQSSALIPLVYGQKYYIRAVWKEGGGGDHCNVAWQGPDQPITPTYGSPAAVINGNRLSPFVQLWAHDPDPRDGQASVPAGPQTLRWGPGDHAAKHDVYFGTDKAAVESATTLTPGIYKGRYDPNSFGPLLLDAAKFYYFRVDEVNSLGPAPGLWKGATWTFRTEGAAGGLLGLYYHWDGILPPALPGGPPDPGPANPFQIFVMSRIEPEVNWNWGDFSPDPNINVDNFACKWVGHVECPVDADYTFYTTTDDGARLFINGVQILPTDAWQQQGMTEWSGTVTLAPGLHDIEMHHEEGGGGAGAQLRWSAIPTNPLDDAISKQIIPAMWLWPPLFASGPRPPDNSTIDERMPALEWIPGVNADFHELYFSSNYDDVNNRNPAVKQIVADPCYPYPAVPLLELGKTYYWLVDEVKSIPAGRWDARGVWSFTTNECLSLDNFEDYNDRGELRRVWRDGSANVVWGGTYPFLTLVQGGSSGSNLNVSTAVGGFGPGGAGPQRGTSLNYEAMVLRYDNDGFTYTGLPGEEEWVYDAPYYSEIEANTIGTNGLGIGQTWDSEGVKSFTMWFQGHPISDGFHDTSAWPAFTLHGRGRDLWGRHDEFYYFSNYPLTGAGLIHAEVTRIDNTANWALAGVMIREKMTPYSKHASVFITPNQGVTFYYRETENGPTLDVTKPGVTAPQYVRLERTISGVFQASHSADGSNWYDVNAPGVSPVYPTISMGTISDPNIYVGTAVSSVNGSEVCSADFNNVHLDPWPTGWGIGNIGTNDPEQLYVALSDGTNTAVVEHNDLNAATVTTWQEWNIKLSDFTGVNLDGIKKVYIGLGDRDVPAQGGSGAIYVDDIRGCPPRCVAALAKPLYDIARPYDCIVNELDLVLVGADWLIRDELITTVAPNPANLLASYQFESNYFDTSGNNHHLIDPCSSSPGFDTGVVGSFALSLDGVDDWLVADSNVGVDGNDPRTIAGWAKANVPAAQITGWTPAFGFTSLQNAPLGGKSFDIERRGGDQDFYCMHVYGWEENIMPMDQDWHHLAGTYDGTTIVWYGDGVRVGSVDREIDTEDNVQVGKRGHNAGGYWPGLVDEFRIYDYALSDEEIAYLATDGAASLHIPIGLAADVYQGEAQGNQLINFNDYSLIAGKYLEEVLWPAP